MREGQAKHAKILFCMDQCSGVCTRSKGKEGFFLEVTTSKAPDTPDQSTFMNFLKIKLYRRFKAKHVTAHACFCE